MNSSIVSPRLDFYLLLSALFTLLVTSNWLYAAFTGPARHVKGPWYSRFTRLPLKIAVITGKRAYFLDDLHKKYGPFVRIAPDEVAIADLQALRTIHKVGSKYLKSNWYNAVDPNGFLSSFSLIDPFEHARRRKYLSRPFSHAYLSQHWDSTVRERVALCISRIKEAAQKDIANVYVLWMLLASDVSTQLLFGESFHMLESGKESKLISDIKKVSQVFNMLRELPLLYYLRYLPSSSMADAFNGDQHLITAAKRAIEIAKSQTANSNLLSAIIDDSKDEGGLRDGDIESEARVMLVAGTDTTAVTLTYLVWKVLQNPVLQSAIEEEVAKLPENFTESEVEALPLLSATINETLRLHNPVPASLPRVVPKGGVTFGGYFFHERCIVSTQSYTFHRDPTIWKDPLDFNPERWLLDKENPASALKPDAKAAYHPFGAGSRTCIGIHLAQMELRYASAMFFRELRGAKLAPSTTPESMRTKAYFLTSPISKRCDVMLPK